MENFSTPLNGFYIDTVKMKKEITRSVRNLVKRNDSRRIECIVICGHGNGCYFLGNNGILKKGVSSMITNTCPVKSDKLLQLTGQNSWDGQPLSILSWMKKKNEKEIKQIQKILFCKDYLRYFMTGEASTDYSDASAAGLLDQKKGEYSEQILSIYGLEEYGDSLPSIFKCTDAVGKISAAFSEESGLEKGTAVLAGLFDVSSCMLGTGITEPGSFAVISGTWGIHASLTEKMILNADITQACYYLVPGQFMCVDSAATSLANINLFVKQEGAVSAEQRNEMVERAKPDANLFYMPYCYQPMDLSNVKAEYIGLKPEHTRMDRLRAVYEGVVFEHVRRLEKLKKMGVKGKKIILSGGGAKSAVLSQMLADVSGLPVEIKREKEAGALGGAILATVALEKYNDLHEAVERMVSREYIYEPNPSLYYQEKYAAFLKNVNKKRKGEEK